MPVGLYRHGSGWKAVVSQGRDRPQLYRLFPKDTPVSIMQAWRRETQARAHLTRKHRATSGMFEADAKRYLKAVSALPTLSARTRDIEVWIAIFGRRYRDTITSAEIRHWRDRWIREPRAKGQPPYAASTINHRLRALSNLWTVLDGRRAPNPVRDVPEVREPDAKPREIPYALIEQIIDAIPDRGRPEKNQPVPDFSLTKLRLRVLAYTGLTYSQLARLTPADLDLDAATMYVTRREKGAGARPRVLPLLDPAVTALRALEAVDGFGAFSGASVRKTFMLAVGKLRKAGVKIGPVRVYDLRHSLGSVVYRATHSREAVRELLQHESLRTTARYTLSAVNDVLTAQLKGVPLHDRRSSHAVTPSKHRTKSTA